MLNRLKAVGLRMLLFCRFDPCPPHESFKTALGPTLVRSNTRQFSKAN